MPFLEQGIRFVVKYNLSTTHNIPTILQLNGESLTKSKIDVTEQLSQSSRAQIVLLLETHSTSVAKLVLSQYVLAVLTSSF